MRKLSVHFIVTLCTDIDVFHERYLKILTASITSTVTHVGIPRSFIRVKNRRAIIDGEHLFAAIRCLYLILIQDRFAAYSFYRRVEHP
jgi:hypothetical protein